MRRPQNLMAVKEIAFELGRSRSWVHSVKTAMEKAGIHWTAGMISIEAFLTWVMANNHKSTEYYRKSKDERIGA